MALQRAMGAGVFAAGANDSDKRAAAAALCPACDEPVRNPALENYGKYKRFACAACGLEFWEPREMPDARWYERIYGGRDEELMPLEPGHKYFLEDAAAPHGELLDVGCGTGNFLAAARDAGYRVTGIELDRNAARFAKERLGLQEVLPLTISEFAAQNPGEKFDLVTFFEVLEHQAAPAEFLRSVKSSLKPRGSIALSVPNRERWLTGPDVLDYPPNHFLRWNAAALKHFLRAQGFEVLTIREQPAGIVHTAQMINMALRTRMSQSVVSDTPKSFRDVIQMTPNQAEAVLRATPTTRERAVEILGGIKYAACLPLAVVALPYVRMRGYKGTYLYCLARRCD